MLKRRQVWYVKKNFKIELSEKLLILFTEKGLIARYIDIHVIKIMHIIKNIIYFQHVDMNEQYLLWISDALVYFKLIFEWYDVRSNCHLEITYINIL